MAYASRRRNNIDGVDDILDAGASSEFTAQLSGSNQFYKLAEIADAVFAVDARECWISADLGHDMVHPELFRSDDEVGSAGRRLMETHLALGCEPTFTCAPDQLKHRPGRGEAAASSPRRYGAARPPARL